MHNHDDQSILQIATVAANHRDKELRRCFGPRHDLVLPTVRQLFSKRVGALDSTTKWTLRTASNGAAYLVPTDGRATYQLALDDVGDSRLELPDDVAGLVLTLEALQSLAEVPSAMLGIAHLKDAHDRLYAVALQSAHWTDIFNSRF